MHVPLTQGHQGLIGAETIARMKTGAVMINAARGGIVDEAALYDALVSGKLRGAGLDVFAQEPADPNNPLFRLDQVVVTPHIAGSAIDLVADIARHAFTNMQSVLSGEPLPPDDVIVAAGGEQVMATLQSRSVRRREDVRLLTGKGNYSADPQPPGMLHAVLVRSHHAHATIGGIDASAARAMPGVVAVFTAADLTDVAPIPGGIGFPRPDGSPAPKTDRPLLAADRVRFVGEPVAVVLAETIGAGKDAAEAVMVDYHELPLVTDAIAALEPASPKVWDDVPDNIGFLWKRGDAEATDAALRSAAHVARLQFTVSRVTANTMEPRGVWAEIGQRRPHRGARRASVAVQPAQRHGERQFQHQADRYPRADRRCRRLVRHEVGRAAGIRAGRLGGAQAAASGALDLRSHRGLSQRRAGARDAHHGGAWRSMPTTNSPR